MVTILLNLINDKTFDRVAPPGHDQPGNAACYQAVVPPAQKTTRGDKEKNIGLWNIKQLLPAKEKHQELL